MDIYSNILNLCEKKGISIYKFCQDTDIRQSLLTDLKMGRKTNIRVDTAIKIASYFKVSVEDLCETDTIQLQLPVIDDNDLKIALWGHNKISDKALKTIRDYAAYVEQREKDETIEDIE